MIKMKMSARHMKDFSLICPWRSQMDGSQVWLERMEPEKVQRLN